MCFDTTACNTGPKNGACVLLESMINKSLYSLACRHHTHELIVAATFDSLFEAYTGPQIKMFQTFSDNWDTIDRNNYSSGMDDPVLQPFLQTIKDETVSFIHVQLKNFHPREEYLELLNLNLLLFNEKTKQVNIYTVSKRE